MSINIDLDDDESELLFCCEGIGSVKNDGFHVGTRVIGELTIAGSSDIDRIAPPMCLSE